MRNGHFAQGSARAPLPSNRFFLFVAAGLAAVFPCFPATGGRPGADFPMIGGTPGAEATTSGLAVDFWGADHVLPTRATGCTPSSAELRNLARGKAAAAVAPDFDADGEAKI